MNFKKYSLLFIITIFISILFIGNVLAEEALIDPDIPDSWYEDPKLASELKIDKFNQASMLDDKVNTGELPPVKERLPDNPPVVEPYKEIGNYGGEAHIWFQTDLNFNNGGWQTFTSRYTTRFTRSTPDGSKPNANIIKDWEYSNNYKEITYHLREGLKWSDGHTFTSEDFIYWWDHVANNKELNPVSPENWDPPLLNVTAADKYTVTFHYKNPAPTKHLMMHIHGPGEGVLSNPKHYMKQFHPDFVDKEELMKKVEEAELDHWSDYYEYKQSTSHPERGIRPSMNMFVVTDRSTNRIVTTRNPYFPFIDTEGNQLPYIDKVIRHKASQAEMLSTKAATGEATIAGNHLKVTDVPLYKKNAEKENFKTLLYSAGYASWLTIQPNLSHENPKIREIYLDFKFRQALSHAIDRKNINNKIFYGKAIPRQSTVLPQNKYFKEEYAEAYVEYNPEKAKKLLDEMGMKDVNGDGWRERPDGEIFNPQLIYMKGSGPRTEILELVTTNFQDIGLNIDLKLLGRDLFIERRSANNFDISMWTLDAATNLMFPNNLGKSFVPYNCWAPLTPWPGYVTWSNTNGEEGIEPPQKIMELVEEAKILQTSTDPEKRENAGKNIVKAQAENLWTIGTVGLGPAPVIVNENLRNIPEKGLWVYDVVYMGALYPSQFYFENE